MSRTLRFCSWNIQVGMRRVAVMDLVKHHPDFRGLDLLALQEASAHEHGDDASSIAALMGEHYDSYQHAYHFLDARPQANGLVWNATRVRLDEIEHHALPTYTEVHLSRAERALLNRFKRQPRVNLVGDGAWKGLTLRVCAAHLDVMGYRFKQRQFLAILEELHRRPLVDITILAGDFNTFRLRGRPTWAQLERDAAAYGMKGITDKLAWTQAVRSLRLKQKLDEIFVASTLAYSSRVWTLDVESSDHLPVFAEISFE